MIEILPAPQENIVAMKISGKLTKEDYDRIVPMLESKIKEHGKLRFYGEIVNLELPTLKAIWEELKFDVKHWGDFSRAAIIGEPAWMSSLTKLTAPLYPGELRVYSPQQTEEAMNWLASEL